MAEMAVNPLDNEWIDPLRRGAQAEESWAIDGVEGGQCDRAPDDLKCDQHEPCHAVRVVERMVVELVNEADPEGGGDYRQQRIVEAVAGLANPATVEPLFAACGGEYAVGCSKQQAGCPDPERP